LIVEHVRNLVIGFVKILPQLSIARMRRADIVNKWLGPLKDSFAKTIERKGGELSPLLPVRL
jgi:hypothetical protein